MVVVLDDLCGELSRDRRTRLAREAFDTARTLTDQHAEMVALLIRAREYIVDRGPTMGFCQGQPCGHSMCADMVAANVEGEAIAMEAQDLLARIGGAGG